jgi:hypothetical protein
MMCISLSIHKQNSIYWGAPSIHYPARGQAPEIYASLVKIPTTQNNSLSEYSAKKQSIFI